MTRAVDWSKAHEWPRDKLERELEADTDDVDEGLEATPDEIAQGIVKRRPGQRGPGKRPAKVLMTLRVEAATLEAWRATGPGWQARVNAVLAEAAEKLPKG